MTGGSWVYCAGTDPARLCPDSVPLRSLPPTFRKPSPALHTPSLHPGFVAFHGNRIEMLLDAVGEFMSRYRLAPLESEIVLVQSNGTGEWLKMALAQRQGVCAALSLQLPGQFQWRLYRQVLGADSVPERSPLDRATLTWRLMRVLTDLAHRTDPGAVTAPLANYLGEGEPRRRHQLALQIADLFDQYQVHRPDWLDCWAAGEDVLITARGARERLRPEHRWQALVWQRVLADLAPDERALIRPHVHDRVVDALARHPPGDSSSAALPRRVVVFGLTSLPHPTLRLLAALARHAQVLLAIPNPCRFHWADILEGRELLRAARRRHPLRDDRDLATVGFDQMHHYGNPLLAAWGRQSRDFVRLLDEFDDAEQATSRFDLNRIDLFDDAEPAGASLLSQVQQQIRDLEPLDGKAHPPVPASDKSIVFHIAHGPVRELEVLHDQLLELLAQAPDRSSTGRALRPRDIIVMVPDINRFAPAIRAVFGQYASSDRRHIPFDIADLAARGSSPLLVALQWVMRIREERCTLSALCALFEVPSIAARFGVEPDGIPRLMRWMREAGIRWGLDREQRSLLGLGAAGEVNTAAFGLRRMLLGWAVGEARAASGEAFDGIEPFDEVGGLEAHLAGALAGLLEVLGEWLSTSATPTTPALWASRFQRLLTDLVRAESPVDLGILKALETALERWSADCAAAGFGEAIPLSVAGEAWLAALDAPTLGRAFRGRGVTFCTFTPMRAIPFEVVCLIGMNDGDYPRRAARPDFDLIALAGQRRPGDRARRDDDRQMMLEALLSARRMLYLSWTGRSVRDDSKQPPSVLVAQLRDYLAARWSEQTVNDRTTTHPLQPFSRRYFEADSGLFTHAHEWRAAIDDDPHPPGGWGEAAPSPGTEPAHAPAPDPARTPAQPRLSPPALARMLRNPPRTYFESTLGVFLGEDDAAIADDEPFTLDSLDAYQLLDSIIQGVLADLRDGPADGSLRTDPERLIEARLLRLEREGRLPLGGPGVVHRKSLAALAAQPMRAWIAERDRHPHALERLPLRIELAGTLIEAFTPGRFASTDATQPAIQLHASANTLLESSGKRKPMPHRLLETWVQALLLGALGLSDQLVIVGRDATIRARPTAPDYARERLLELLALHRKACVEPLPVAAKTAIEYCDTQSEDNAAAVYEGSEHVRGEVADPVLARLFPDFEALSADGRFASLAGGCYAELVRWVGTHVTALPHTGAEPQDAPELHSGRADE